MAEVKTAFNVNNLIINRALSGTMFERATGNAMYSIDQIKDPSLECTGETVYSTDAVGVKVAAFDRSKEATLSGSNAFVNLGLAAAQFGSDKKVATSEAKILTPVREIVTVTDGTATLSATPAATSVITVNTMTNDGGLDQTLTKGDSATGPGQFSIEGTTISVHSASYPNTTKLVVFYKKESQEAVQIENRANCFAKGGEFWLEVLFVDPCDTTVEYHGFLVFPNAKMSNETTIDLNNEATHGFKLEAIQDYCDAEKRLFYMVVSK